jgi:peptidoglycan hydrolase-like protein with peptidoglycan-binding domain
MQQDSKVVALRLAPGDQEPTRDGPAIAPSFLPRELAEDLRWVLRQLHGVDTARSEAGASHHPGTRRFIRTWIGTAALIVTGGLLLIVAANERSVDWRRYLRYAGSPGSIHSSTSVESAQASAVPEGASSREHRLALDLLRIEDATRAQQRLADLGFFFGTPNGIFGPRSRQALREFKSANGLVPDDHWNANIQARLFDLHAQRKTERRADAEPRETARVPPPSYGPPTGTMLDPLDRADAARLQRRLADLGFFIAEIDGVWGPGSRAALRDFKIANGLAADDLWDAQTEAALGKRQALRAAEPFIGTWASDAADCRVTQATGIRIGLRRAEGYGAACSFGPMQREGAEWHVKAVCTGNGTAWNANINLAVSGDRLRWSSERGTTVYVRCSRG